MSTNVVTKNVQEERRKLLNSLIPYLAEFLSRITVSDEIIAYLARLPHGGNAILKSSNSYVTFKDTKYLPDFLLEEDFATLSTQKEFLIVLKFLENNKDPNKTGKRFFVSTFKEDTRVLWLDCKTQNIALYSSGVDIRTTPDMFFFYFLLFPHRTQKN